MKAPTTTTQSANSKDRLRVLTRGIFSRVLVRSIVLKCCRRRVNSDICVLKFSSDLLMTREQTNAKKTALVSAIDLFACHFRFLTPALDCLWSLLSVRSFLKCASCLLSCTHTLLDMRARARSVCLLLDVNDDDDDDDA